MPQGRAYEARCQATRPSEKPVLKYLPDGLGSRHLGAGFWRETREESRRGSSACHARGSRPEKCSHGAAMPRFPLNSVSQLVWYLSHERVTCHIDRGPVRFLVALGKRAPEIQPPRRARQNPLRRARVVRGAMSSARGGDQYQIVGQIGEGAFGLVYYARGPQNRVCAIKSFKSNPKDPPVVPAPTIREVHLLTELSHENVLNLLHVQVNHAELALSLVFDYAEHDLDRIIRHHKDAKRGKPIPREDGEEYRVADAERPGVPPRKRVVHLRLETREHPDHG